MSSRLIAILKPSMDTTERTEPSLTTLLPVRTGREVSLDTAKIVWLIMFLSIFWPITIFSASFSSTSGIFGNGSGSRPAILNSACPHLIVVWKLLSEMISTSGSGSFLMMSPKNLESITTAPFSVTLASTSASIPVWRS